MDNPGAGPNRPCNNRYDSRSNARQSAEVRGDAQGQQEDILRSAAGSTGIWNEVLDLSYQVAGNEDQRSMSLPPHNTNSTIGSSVVSEERRSRSARSVRSRGSVTGSIVRNKRMAELKAAEELAAIEEEERQLERLRLEEERRRLEEARQLDRQRLQKQKELLQMRLDMEKADLDELEDGDEEPQSNHSSVELLNQRREEELAEWAEQARNNLTLFPRKTPQVQPPQQVQHTQSLPALTLTEKEKRWLVEEEQQRLLADEQQQQQRNEVEAEIQNTQLKKEQAAKEELEAKKKLNNLNSSSSVMAFPATQYQPTCGLGQVNQVSRPRDNLKKFVARQSAEKDLPIFAGNPEEWPRFVKRFRQSTLTCAFSSSENMARLEKALKGKAKEAVQSILALSDDTEEVIQILEMNFGRPDLIISILIEKVKKTPPAKEDKPETIVELGNAVRGLVSNVAALNCPGQMYNTQLLNDMEEKLSGMMKSQWAAVKRKYGGQVTVQHFADFVKELAMNASYISKPKVEVQAPKDNGQQGDRHQFRGNRRHMVMAVGEGEPKQQGQREENKKTEVKCPLCNKSGHNMAKCWKYEKLDYNDRWKAVGELKLCFCCLNPGHLLQQCRGRKDCGVDGCKKPHHPTLHPCEVRKPEKEKEEKIGTISTSSALSKEVLLRIVPVVLKGPHGEIKTHAFLDPGATCTIIKDSIADQLGLKGPQSTLRMGFADASTHVEGKSRRVDLQVRAAEDNILYDIRDAKTMKGLDLPCQSVSAEVFRKWGHLKSAPSYCFLNKAKPTILIGENHHKLIKVSKTSTGPDGSPSLSQCLLGSFIHGESVGKDGRSFVFHVRDYENEDNLHQLVKDSFKCDALGMEVTEKKLLSKEDERSTAILEATTRRVGDRWETGLLWKAEETRLPDSKSMALQRLKSIEKKMDRDEDMAVEYCNRIDEYVKKGYARELTTEEEEVESPRTWYLPHFFASNPNKPGKYRLVFDAAAKSHGMNGVSLNDTLMKGPDLCNSLVGVLLRFRQNEVAFSGDIKEMFHQVRIRKQDLPSQRFLWRGRNRTEDPKVMEMSVMTFGSTSSPSSAQYVKNRNAREFEEDFPEAVKAIIERHYVDDYLDSKPTMAEAVQLAKDVIEVHRRGGFEIRNWTSNSREFMENIPEQLRGSGVKMMEADTEMPVERVLGLRWETACDLFRFNTSFSRVDKEIVNGSRTPTKREVLGLVMSVYDPLGFLSHYTVKGKILLQNIWKSEIGWDDELQPKECEKWDIWIKELQNIKCFGVPRCLSTLIPKADSIELHTFCDASQEAYCAVSYLRVSMGEEIEVRLVMAKTRVTPIKVMSIPRMELQAALLGSRMASLIKSELDIEINISHYWSDSKTVLCWLRSDTRQFKQFVANRVGEIEETTDVNCWHWVPTKENVSDEATRSGQPTDFSPNSRWVNGPELLLKQMEDWPKEKPSFVEEVSPEELEVKKDYLNMNVKVTPVMDASHYSSWTRLIRTTAYVLRFVNKCRRQKSSDQMQAGLTVSEVRSAEMKWQQWSQCDSFPEEMTSLRTNTPLKPSSRLNQLSPILDEEGIIRVKGRLRSEDLDVGVKQPVILDPSHVYTKLLIDHYHTKGGHHGQERVVNDLRQSFWIINMRTAVRGAWFRCQICKNARAQPTLPEMGDIPSCRLAHSLPAFTSTGLDYFGPLEVTVGRRREKRWVALFVCMTTRAVHVELVEKMDTDSCINAIRRFISLRGRPREFHSDNGTNFRGADAELRKALQELKQEEIQGHMTNEGIEWYFIPPSAPHMGGSWERMVKSVKVALRAMLKEKAPREKTLETFLREATFIVNSRPLTHVSADHEDPESLTPNHFLIGSSGGRNVPGIFNDKDLIVTKQWRFVQRLTDHFWRRWLKEYLPTLAKREKWHRQTKPLEPQDIVMVMDYGAIRNTWILGKVTEVHPGDDGQVRVVTVKTCNGTYKRPVAKLARLDVHRLDDPTTSSVSKAPQATLPMTPFQMEIREMKRSGAWRRIMDEYRQWIMKKRMEVKVAQPVK